MSDADELGRVLFVSERQAIQILARIDQPLECVCVLRFWNRGFVEINVRSEKLFPLIVVGTLKGRDLGLICGCIH